MLKILVKMLFHLIKYHFKVFCLFDLRSLAISAVLQNNELNYCYDNAKPILSSLLHHIYLKKTSHGNIHIRLIFGRLPDFNARFTSIRVGLSYENRIIHQE
jgi:hypothetical protein